MAATKEEYELLLEKFMLATNKFKGDVSHQVAHNTPRAVAPRLVRTMNSKELKKVYAVSWSSKDDLICAAHQEGVVTIKSALSGGHKNMPIIPSSPEQKVVPLATVFLPGDNTIAVGGMDDSVTIYDRSSTTCAKKSVLLSHQGYISALKVLGDRLLSGSGDSTIRLWDTSTGQEVTTFCGHRGDCTDLDTLRDNPNIFVSGSVDASCRLWDARSGKTTRWFRAKYGVNCVSLFPTGSMIACGCDSASFEYWDVGSYNQIARGKVRPKSSIPHTLRAPLKSHLICRCSAVAVRQSLSPNRAP